ncbi:MAG: 1-deoxy-D-xylulose-5-phosphate reductoisomerase [Spirochaetaceae bacterium]|nr:1-deoxy-D-xylulose-5-phosphate reductoisomerase [Spirochaetaceae bacterium]
MKNILILGCTGSIGTSALNIAREFPDRFNVVGLTAHKSKERLQELSKEFGNVPTCLTGVDSEDALERLINTCGADIVVNGIAGSPGLMPSVFVLRAGIDLALANKETIVMAGPLIARLAREHNCRILPVDSEHSAVFTLVEKFGSDSIGQIVLTASGGPFREKKSEDLPFMRPADALKHPTWNMGTKITIDSASLANKGLEVIEACRLFNISPDRVKVTVHPQSLVHSLIRTRDGVLYAQISPPDMRHPILTALTWPDFVPSSLEEWDITAGGTLNFYPPRMNDFPMLPLAYKSLSMASGPIAYNAANEIAVEAFLNGKIAFTQIAYVTDRILAMDWNKEPVTIDDVFLFDNKARQQAKKIVEDILCGIIPQSKTCLANRSWEVLG